MKAQETKDAELVALAALVFHDAVRVQADVAKWGEPQFDPDTEPARHLAAELKERGVL